VTPNVLKDTKIPFSNFGSPHIHDAYNIAQNDQKSARIILGRTGFFNGPLVLELWLFVDQVGLIQSVAYASWYNPIPT
jgi:hypothetical protein